MSVRKHERNALSMVRLETVISQLDNMANMLEAVTRDIYGSIPTGVDVPNAELLEAARTNIQVVTKQCQTAIGDIADLNRGK